MSLSAVYRADDENVPVVVLPELDDFEGVFAARDAISGLPVGYRDADVG
jgi:hypothetical protein